MYAPTKNENEINRKKESSSNHEITSCNKEVSSSLDGNADTSQKTIFNQLKVIIDLKKIAQSIALIIFCLWLISLFG